MTTPTETEIEEITTGAPFGTAPRRPWTTVWVLAGIYVIWVIALVVMAVSGSSPTA